MTGTTRYQVILVLLLSLAGCSTSGGNNRQISADIGNSLIAGASGSSQGSTIVERHLDLIVMDMMTAMVQIQELAPLTTTLQASRPRGTFGVKLVGALERAGYGLQQVPADQGINYLSYENRVIQTDTRDVRDFTIRVGNIELRREYGVTDGKVFPTSIMYIKGSNSFANIVLNDKIFLQQGGELNFASGIELELPDSTLKSTTTRAIQQSANTAAGVGLAPDSVEQARNLTLGKGSKTLLERKDEYRALRRAEIKFSDQTMQLGRQNKAIIKSLLQDYNAASDALFISACADASGQQSLADRRSTRIKEEFILNNVPVALVVQQGCELSDYPGDLVPDRSVIVVQRRVAEDAGVAVADLPVSYPNRPLAMTIPYGAGGATDFQARIVTMVASEQDMLGQPIMIINKPGQGGQDGWSWFAETAKDTGYDLATYNVPHFIAQSIKYSTPYNIDTLEPLANWGADPAVLVVPASSRFKTLRQFVRYARRNPGKTTVSGAGLYVGHHIAFLQLQKGARITLDYKWDKGGAAALQQVANAEVMSGFNNMSDAFRIGNKVRILAVADLQRNPVIPSVPTFAELGVDIDNSSVNYRGLMVPKGTPPKIVNALSEAALRMFEKPVVREKMKEGGAPMQVMNREEVLAMWRERQSYLNQLLKDL